MAQCALKGSTNCLLMLSLYFLVCKLTTDQIMQFTFSEFTTV